MSAGLIYLILSGGALVFEINTVGRLTLADVMLTSIAPFLAWFNRNARLKGSERQFFYLAAAWLLGAVITDVVRQSSFDDFSRGWTKIAFFIGNFAALLFLQNRSQKRSAGFILVLAAASAIRLYLNMDGSDIGQDPFGNGWRFGYGQLLATAVFLSCAFMVAIPMTRIAALCLPAVDAFINLSLNARNLFGVSALSAAIFITTVRRRRPLSPAFVALGGAAAAMLVWGVISAYSYAAGSGLLGPMAEQKYEFQSSGNLGILLGGRAEFFGSTQAILDSPIIGHGSWARDIYYVDLMRSRMTQAGYELSNDPNIDDLIPTHSHLFGAWVESGILGAVFWLWAMWIIVKGIYSSVMRPSPMSGFVVFVGLSLLWDIVFSPFGLERRVLTPAALILMINAAESLKKNSLQEARE